MLGLCDGWMGFADSDMEAVFTTEATKGKENYRSKLWKHLKLNF
jgi:hypothetical protein